jgi:hypothetical protein
MLRSVGNLLLRATALESASTSATYVSEASYRWLQLPALLRQRCGVAGLHTSAPVSHGSHSDDEGKEKWVRLASRTPCGGRDRPASRWSPRKSSHTRAWCPMRRGPVSCRISVTFIDKDGAEHTVQAPVGMNLLEVAHKNEVDLEGVCAWAARRPGGPRCLPAARPPARARRAAEPPAAPQPITGWGPPARHMAPAWRLPALSGMWVGPVPCRRVRRLAGVLHVPRDR